MLFRRVVSTERFYCHNLPAAEADFIASKVQVMVGEHLLQFLDESVEEVIVSIICRINRAIITIKLP